MALVNAGGTGDSSLAAPPARPAHPATPTEAKNQKIRVSPAVLEAALKDGDALLQSLDTKAGGLTQAEAEGRARTVGPNQVTQERRQGSFVRLLKIIRNPLVILLAVLATVFFDRRRESAFFERPLRQAGEPHGRVAADREVPRSAGGGYQFTG